MSWGQKFRKKKNKFIFELTIPFLPQRFWTINIRLGSWHHLITLMKGIKFVSLHHTHLILFYCEKKFATFRVHCMVIGLVHKQSFLLLPLSRPQPMPMIPSKASFASTQQIRNKLNWLFSRPIFYPNKFWSFISKGRDDVWGEGL